MRKFWGESETAHLSSLRSRGRRLWECECRECRSWAGDRWWTPRRQQDGWSAKKGVISLFTFSLSWTHPNLHFPLRNLFGWYICLISHLNNCCTEDDDPTPPPLWVVVLPECRRLWVEPFQSWKRECEKSNMKCWSRETWTIVCVDWVWGLIDGITVSDSTQTWDVLVHPVEFLFIDAEVTVGNTNTSTDTNTNNAVWDGCRSVSYNL